MNLFVLFLSLDIFLFHLTLYPLNSSKDCTDFEVSVGIYNDVWVRFGNEYHNPVILNYTPMKTGLPSKLS